MSFTITADAANTIVMTDDRRSRRVGETIRKHIAEALSRELFDPRLAGLMVTKVVVGSDLSLARINLRAMTGEVDAKRRRQVEEAANRAAPMLRRGLNSKLGIRKLPEMKFHYDEGQDAIDRVEELLDEISRAPRASDSE